ncbi:hypothetical protein FB45DRAFT_966468 [Roridomyces roridus]|uniref:Endopeptidase S2P n=1 Tax=Roridomyces roridus TaxID=1738132 RepID=A0AAD7AX32_9AGAR|nr:hypothetical protein FB45DRAFT_966468 [Roridomyces roridus]
MRQLLLLSLLWALIHATHYFSRSSAETLPTTARKRRNNTQVVLKKLHLRVLTFALNGPHEKLIKAISTRRATRLAVFYNLGCICGGLGVIIALGLLVWNCSQTLLPLLHSTRPVGLVKRGLELVEEAATQNSIQPLIPGLTVPLSHLPAILAAVFFSQIVHELGHAVSAALDAVPILSAGASFTVLIPAAFVTFPTAALDALKPLSRARIIAAGPFHNLVFWGILLLVDRLGIGTALTRLLYQDVSHIGRVVVGIDADSDLHRYLPVGALITQLDDTLLGGAEDHWTSYLTSPPTPLALGWCVERASFLASPRTCCDPTAPPSDLSCFVAEERGCLEAVAVLANQTTPRCTTSSNCSEAATCVRPDASAQILRLTVRFNEQVEQVILWSGPRVEVLEQLKIGTFLPRTRLTPLGLWTAVQTLYLKTATLSLYLFNLLPLPYLDGTQFVNALLDVAFESGPQTEFEEYDVGALEEGVSRRGRNRNRWKVRVGRGITVTTAGLFVLCAVLALLNTR